MFLRGVLNCNNSITKTDTQNVFIIFLKNEKYWILIARLFTGVSTYGYYDFKKNIQKCNKKVEEYNFDAEMYTTLLIDDVMPDKSTIKRAAKQGVKDSDGAFASLLADMKKSDEYDKIKAYMTQKDQEHEQTTVHLRELKKKMASYKIFESARDLTKFSSPKK